MLALGGILAAWAGLEGLTRAEQAFPKAFWYASRATGWVAYGLLWLETVLGLATSGRVAQGRSAAVLVELHQFAAALALAFSAVHALVLLGDHYVKPTLAAVVGPFMFPYRPGWVGLGQLAAYTAAAVYVTTLLRRYTGYRFWRTVHYAGLGAYVLATLHLVGAGSDVGEVTGAVVVASASVVCGWMWLRWWTRSQNPRAGVTDP